MLLAAVLVAALSFLAGLYLSNLGAHTNDIVQVISIEPAKAFPPAGPIVNLTIRNTSNMAITSLKATLFIGQAYSFQFTQINSSTPLGPQGTASSVTTLLGGGYVSNVKYQALISGTFQNGSAFSYSTYVQIG